MRFYLFRLKDASGVLTVQSRTLRSGANDNVLWLSEISQSYSWQRAEATFSSSVNSKVREDQDFCIYHKVNCAFSARGHLATSLCQQQQQQRVRSFLWPTTYARTPPEKIWIQIKSLYRTKVLESEKRTCYNIRYLLFPLRLSSGMKVVMDTEGLLRWMTSLSQGSAYLTLKTATCQTPRLHPAQPQQAPPIHVR